MRPRTLLGEVQNDLNPPARPDTYERVRRTLDDALAELELPSDDDKSGPINIGSTS
jgi:hypothetical protein